MYLLYIFIFEIILLTVITIIFIIISKKNISIILNIEKFGNNIIFLNKNELFNILKNNDDRYNERFFKNDFYARKVNNIYEYINIMYTSSTNFNNSQKNKLIQCCENADTFFKKINYKWLNNEKILNIDWKLGCIQGKYYENGLPHTRSDIIVLPNIKVDKYSEERLTQLLIHEKIHLYQKRYPDDVDVYIKENNYRRIKKREEKDNIRANPDLDEWIYVDSKNKINKASYNDNPTSIEDIKYYPINNQNYEHPYERMAIEIENLYKK